MTPGEVYQLDVEIWPTSLIIPDGYRLALTVGGKDFDHCGKGARLDHFANDLRGCGPFLHDDPDDRTADVFGGQATLHTGGDYESSLLVPLIPAGNRAAQGTGLRRARRRFGTSRGRE